ncbi:MAG: dTDP-glucose 4,6-dehydratase [bacterium]
MATVFVTGGAGFIGSALVRYLIEFTNYHVVNIDKLTYAGNLDSLASVDHNSRYTFQRLDICDGLGLRELFERYQPIGVFHLAAESHVDRSIDGPTEFVKTNVVGTFMLLEEALAYWRGLASERRNQFRFLHVSTDEVFGTLGISGYFTEAAPYAPNSPYSATKASSDHLARAWYHTYGLPTITTNCSNNYGPYQFPEKLIPVLIQRALAGEPLPVYGRGENVRDWMFVDDHVAALQTCFERGIPGETYCIGGRSERRNIDVVNSVCALLDEFRPSRIVGGHCSLISFVADRPGHDFRYAIDSSRLETQLGWHCNESFETGLRKTVRWYLDNQIWVERVRSGQYRGERLGLQHAASYQDAR